MYTVAFVTAFYLMNYFIQAFKILISLIELWGVVRVILIMSLIVYYLLFPEFGISVLNSILEFFLIPNSNSELIL